MQAHSSRLTRRALLTDGAAVLLGTAFVLRRPDGTRDKKMMAPPRTTTDGVDRRRQFRELVRCGGRTIYVHGQGRDHGAGSATDPFRQISRAVAEARPGDLIQVGDGSYGYTEVRAFHGDDRRWLGIMTANDGVRARITVAPPTDNFVNVIDSSFVGLYGFEVAGDQRNPNTNGSGISVYGNSHHVVLWANHVHDFPGGGINCFDVDGSHDLVDISYNRIHATSRYSPSNTSGISIYASRDLTGGATLPGGYGYRIVGNYIYDVVCTVPFTPGGLNFVTDGNGVSVDSLRSMYRYTKPVLVQGNTITGCGGRAVHVFDSVNTTISANTAVGNMRTPSPAISGGAELDGTTDRSVRIDGNTILPLHTTRTRDATSFYSGNIILGGSQAVGAGDTDRRNIGWSYFRRRPMMAQINGGATSSDAFLPRTGR